MHGLWWNVPTGVRELADAMEGPVNSLWVIMGLAEVPQDWRKANATPAWEKDKKEDAGTKKPLNLISIPGIHQQIPESYLLRINFQLCHWVDSFPKSPFIKISFSHSLSSDCLIIAGNYFEKQIVLIANPQNFSAPIRCNRQQFGKGGQKLGRRGRSDWKWHFPRKIKLAEKKSKAPWKQVKVLLKEKIYFKEE